MTPSRQQSRVAWCLYILRCSDASLYTGITNNLEARLERHQSGLASKYTRARLPVAVVYREPCRDRSHASKREWAIKRLTRDAKLALIESSTQA